MGRKVIKARTAAISILSAAVIISALFYIQSEYAPFNPPKTVNLVFKETGLPQNSTWGIQIYANAYQYSTAPGFFSSYNTSNTSLTVSTPNTHPYYITLSPIGYQAMNNSVVLPHFNHRNAVIRIVFQKLYSVSFEEEGLPENSSWSVTTNYPGNNILSSPDVLTSNTSHQQIMLVNGTYNYSAGIFDTVIVNNTTYYAMYGSMVDLQDCASFNLSGHNMSIPIKFSTQSYKISVSETGFPSDRLSWNITILGGTSSSYSDFLGGYYPFYFYVGNGTYQYQAETAAGYNSPNSSGALTVSGKNTTLVIEYDRVIQS